MRVRSIVCTLAVVLVVLTSCGGGTGGTPAAAIQRVTMDGNDGTGIIINPINLFKTYSPRGPVVGNVTHGATVALLKHEGGAVLVRTDAGVEGWCNEQFVKEFK